MEKRLGKGLAQILEVSAQANPNFVMLRTEQIKPGRYQPREAIRPAELEELKASIKRHGVIEPIIVRPIAHGTYELVAGERRWRAIRELGITDVPAIIRALTDQETLEYSLVENLQREALNALEEANAFNRLIAEFGHTQEQVAEAVGKDRSSVANTLRLLKLPSEIQAALAAGNISAGHAKALLTIEATAKQLEIFQMVIAKRLSVRDTEALAGQARPAGRRRGRPADPQAVALENELRQALATKVIVKPRRKGGRIIIDYFSIEDLSRLAQLLGAAS